MKLIFFFILALNCSFFFSQSVNLGTTYFRNDRFLISFDKVLYPGYNLRIENLKKREYLMGNLIQDTTFSGSWDFMSEYFENSYVYSLDFYYDYSAFPCIFIDIEECFNFNGKIKISGNKISSEDYQINDDFKVYAASSAPIKRMNIDGSKVEVVSIESNIDVLTNQIQQTEIILETRPLSDKEVADKEGNIYMTTTIGDQTWMAENVRATKFSNGIEIPILTEAQWANSTAPGIISIDPEGTFYNFYTLASENNICPQGFHVPDNYDIARLYNTITPYDDHLKISKGVVKKKVYAPLLAPIAIPALSFVNIGWWSFEVGVVTGIAALASAADIAIFSTEIAVSPLFGWRTKKSQYKSNLKRAKKYSFINEHGVPVEFNGKTNVYSITNLKPLNKSEWDNFKILQTVDKENYNFISDKRIIDSLKSKHIDYPFKLKFKPFCIPGTDVFWSFTGRLIEKFEGTGGFFAPIISVMPYRKINENDYPIEKYNSSLGRGFNRQPVITLLLNKGENEFADQYSFNLNFDNGASTVYGGKKSSSTYFNFRTGISYLNDFGYPGYFGIGGKDKYSKFNHELNLISSGKENKTYVMRMQTRVRCVKD
ncbi:MAG: FISUMP domain-containing protein [Bacteroidota bacterium]